MNQGVQLFCLRLAPSLLVKFTAFEKENELPDGPPKKVKEISELVSIRLQRFMEQNFNYNRDPKLTVDVINLEILLVHAVQNLQSLDDRSKITFQNKNDYYHLAECCGRLASCLSSRRAAAKPAE